MTPSDVIDIREAKGKVLGKDLARKYRVPTSVIYAIQNGKSHTWVKSRETPPRERASITREEFFDSVDSWVEYEGFAPPKVRAMVKMLRKEGVKIIRKVRYEIID